MVVLKHLMGLFGMLITDYTGNNEYGSNYRLIENDIDRFFAGMSRRNIEWLRTSYSVLVYNDKYPVDNDLYHPSLRFAYRIFEPENDPIISDLAIQFMNFIQFNYLNKRSLKRFGEQKLITLGVEISNFLSNISPNWDFYYFTGSVISNLIDTFEKLPSEIKGQLKEGGRIACLFSEGALGIARIGIKINDTITWQYLFNAGAPVLAGFEAETTFNL